MIDQVAKKTNLKGNIIDKYLMAYPKIKITFLKKDSQNIDMNYKKSDFQNVHIYC